MVQTYSVHFWNLKIALIVALGATFGSLYFSEVLGFPPCVLCWYQRISIYPLVVIFSSALWFEDQNYKRYAIPIILCGLSVSVYHNMIYYGWIAEGLTPCTEGISCSSRQLELFGFVTIPLLSLGSFLGLLILMALDSTANEGKS